MKTFRYLAIADGKNVAIKSSLPINENSSESQKAWLVRECKNACQSEVKNIVLVDMNVK